MSDYHHNLTVAVLDGGSQAGVEPGHGIPESLAGRHLPISFLSSLQIIIGVVNFSHGPAGSRSKDEYVSRGLSVPHFVHLIIVSSRARTYFKFPHRQFLNTRMATVTFRFLLTVPDYLALERVRRWMGLRDVLIRMHLQREEVLQLPAFSTPMKVSST